MLCGCSINQTTSIEDKRDLMQYHVSLIDVEEELPIVVIHQTKADDVESFLFKKKFDGSFLPTAHKVVETDQLVIDRLKHEKPEKQYFRQYGGFTAGGTDYLWIQLTSKRLILKDESLDLWDLSSYFNGFLKVWDGGDDFGEAVIKLETGEILHLQFNGNV